ncbi:MAG: 23S rRNA (pseudouridine(1915)-N(3))-methyltransferase RlmH [Gammaproteobacteria bacterium]
MRLDVLCVCRRPPRWVVEVTADYARRLPRGIELSFHYVAPGGDALASVERRRDEAARVLKRLRAGTPVVALDVGGDEVDSPGVARWLSDWRARDAELAFVVGGADGHGDAVLERSRQRWSLSRLTLPHLLVQVVLAEQIYRAWTILDGHPYHRA